MTRDVFTVNGAPDTWRQRLMVTCLAWGTGAVISHKAAAALWRLVTFRHGPIEVTVPAGRRRKGLSRPFRHALARVDVTVVEGIPVTTPARTLLDIASVCPVEQVEEALDDAFARCLVSLPRLRWTLERHARSGRPGVGVLRDLLAMRDGTGPAPRSVMETRMIRTLRRAGLPRPETQYPVRLPSGRMVLLDFAYPHLMVGIETDGFRWHTGRLRWERDHARRNALTLMGRRILTVTWDELDRDPDGVGAKVASAAATGRWSLR